MAFLSDADLARIQAAVAAAERGTSGELVTHLAPECSRYNGTRLGLPALVALAVPFVALGFGISDDAIRIAQAQLVVFAALALALQWTPLAMALVPAGLKRANAEREARAEFHRLGLHTTRNRAAVLFFVAVAEHHVEVLADTGIADRVDPAEWRAIVDRFVADVRAGRVADGYEAAVTACGALLAQHFPAGAVNPNELPDAMRRE